jgi:hypothetical protein
MGQQPFIQEKNHITSQQTDNIPKKQKNYYCNAATILNGMPASTKKSYYKNS